MSDGMCVGTKKKTVAAVALLLCALLLLSACDEGKAPGDPDPAAPPIEVMGDSYPLRVRDFYGNMIELAEQPKRVAVLSAAALNIWYDVGGKSVCTASISENLKVIEAYEEEIRGIPTVGKVALSNLEAIVSYEPDLVIVQENSHQSGGADWLREHGYPVITTHLRDLEDVVATYRAFGKLVGNSALAEEKIGALEGRYEALIQKAPTEGKRVAILFLTSKKLQVKLSHSIAGIVAEDLGLVNVAAGLSPVEEGSENATLDMEYLVETQPDLILVTSMISDNETAVATMREHFATNDAWKGVSAVQNGRVVYLPQEYFLYNAGPYYDEALRYMACSVYPEIYGDVDGWYGR